MTRVSFSSSGRSLMFKKVREYYLRDDIDCRIKGVSANPFTTEDADKVLILDYSVIADQFDSLLSPKFENVIILQTVYNMVGNRSLQLKSKIDEIIGKSGRHFMLFPNEHHRSLYIGIKKGQTIMENNYENIHNSIEFFNSMIKAVFIVSFEEDKERLKNLGPSYDVITLEQFADGDETILRSIKTKAETLEKDSVLYDEYYDDIEVQKLIKEGKVIVGVYNSSSFSRQEGYVSSPASGVSIIGKENVNRAIDGDKVAVLLHPEESWLDSGSGKHMTGKVVSIIHRPDRVICGTIVDQADSKKGRQNVLFVPMNKAIPKIRIAVTDVKNLIGKRIQVSIDTWKRNSKYPSGFFVAVVGESGELATESEVILLTYNIPHNDFQDSVIACLPPDNYTVDKEERARRVDLNDRLVCSIDPPGCVDIDDALHYKEIDDTYCEIGIHIADVSHFVKEGTAIDIEARNRGTSVYLVEKRINMLPSLLSENLCSLMGGIERCAFSVIAIVNKSNGETKDIKFCKSLITSRYAFAYEEAQDLIDNGSKGDELKEKLRPGLIGLLHIARIYNKKRRDNHSLELASGEVKFKIDPVTKKPLDAKPYVHYEVNMLIEEFMLFANVEAAKKIYGTFVQSAMLRCHDPPSPSGLDHLNKNLKRFNVALDSKDNKSLVESLNEVGRVTELDKFIRIMTTRSMRLAKYFSSGTKSYENFFHFGLAAPIYTHFTSPIRRYCDIIVHRQLSAIIGYSQTTDILSDKLQISAIADHINMRNKMAADAGRRSSELFLLEYLKDLPEKERKRTAIVFMIKPNCIIVSIDDFGVDGRVSYDPSQFLYDPNEETLKSKDDSKIIRVFDKINVEVYVKEHKYTGNEIDIRLVD